MTSEEAKEINICDYIKVRRKNGKYYQFTCRRVVGNYPGRDDIKLIKYKPTNKLHAIFPKDIIEILK